MNFYWNQWNGFKFKHFFLFSIKHLCCYYSIKHCIDYLNLSTLDSILIFFTSNCFSIQQMALVDYTKKCSVKGWLFTTLSFSQSFSTMWWIPTERSRHRENRIEQEWMESGKVRTVQNYWRNKSQAYGNEWDKKRLQIMQREHLARIHARILTRIRSFNMCFQIPIKLDFVMKFLSLYVLSS